MCTKISPKTFGRFKNFDYFCTVIQHISHTASQRRSLAASQPKSIPIYIGARHSRKYLIFSMNSLKPATAITASAGIRRMEAGKLSALGMRTCGGKGAGQWPLAMGCAKREHLFCNTSAHRANVKRSGRIKWMKTAYSTQF